MKCIHCDALAIEVAELREALKLANRTEIIGHLQMQFRLTPAEAKVVDALYQAGGKPVRYDALEIASSRAFTREDGGTSLKTNISRIRASMLGKESVITITGLGYAISQEARALIHTALSVQGVKL